MAGMLSSWAGQRWARSSASTSRTVRLGPGRGGWSDQCGRSVGCGRAAGWSGGRSVRRGPALTGL